MNSKRLKHPKRALTSVSSGQEDEVRHEIDTALKTLSKKDRDLLTAQFLGDAANAPAVAADLDELMSGKPLSEAPLSKTRGDTAQALRHLMGYSQKLRKRFGEDTE